MSNHYYSFLFITKNFSLLFVFWFWIVNVVIFCYKWITVVVFVLFTMMFMLVFSVLTVHLLEFVIESYVYVVCLFTVLCTGTVFVEPESVDFSPAFQELETSRAKSKFKGKTVVWLSMPLIGFHSSQLYWYSFMSLVDHHLWGLATVASHCLVHHLYFCLLPSSQSNLHDVNGCISLY